MARSNKVDAKEEVLAKTAELTITRPIFSDIVTEREFRRNGYVVRPLLKTDEVLALSNVYHSCLDDVPTDQLFSTRCSDAIRERIHYGILPFVQPHLKDLVPGHTIRLNSFITKRPNGPNGPVPLHRDPAFVDPSIDTAVHVWWSLSWTLTKTTGV